MCDGTHRVLDEIGVELGSSPDHAAVDAIADWEVAEDEEGVADPAL